MPGQSAQVPPASVLVSVFLCLLLQDREPFFKFISSPSVPLPAQLSVLLTPSPLGPYKEHPGMGVSQVLQTLGQVLLLSLPGGFPEGLLRRSPLPAACLRASPLGGVGEMQEEGNLEGTEQYRQGVELG